MDDGVVLDRVVRHLVDVHRATTHIRANRVPEANGVASDDHGPDVHALNALVGADGVFGDEGVFGVVEELHVEGESERVEGRWRGTFMAYSF